MPITHKLIVKKDDWDKVKKEHLFLDKVKIKAGLFGVGDPSRNVAARGLVLEFGSNKMGIVARPFERRAFDTNLKKNMAAIKKWYILFLNEKISFKDLQNKIGVLFSDQIKLSILGEYGRWTPLRKETVRRKKSSRPLIDKAIMVNSVKHRIVIKG